MACFLFPALAAPQGLRPRNCYGTILTDIVRASSDAIDALTLYRRLLFTNDTYVDDAGFTAFDAHVGDTSCQLRAGMLLDLTKMHRHWASSSCDKETSWLDRYIERLTNVLDGARKMLAKLTIERVHPEKLGIGPKKDSPDGLLRKLGWDEQEILNTITTLYPAGQSKTPRTHESYLNGWDLTGVEEEQQKQPVPSCTEDSWWQIRNDSAVVERAISRREDKTMVIVDDIDVRPAAETVLSSSASTASSNEGVDGIEWNPLSPCTMVRFLTYSFVLSKYKCFRRFQHVVGARIDFEAVIQAGDEMVGDVWDYSVRDYKYSKSTRRIELEIGRLQSWISKLSSAWLYDIAKASSASPGIESLMIRTTRTSSTDLTCVPTYVGYLAIRELWGRDTDALILVDRHFCDGGYHSNFFLATLRLESTNATTDRDGLPPQRLPLKHRVTWEIERISKDWLQKHQDQHHPHIIIMGNSIEGSYEDYMTASSTRRRHETHSCDDNEAHIAKFLAHDHDRLTLSFFARHRHYTFDLNSSKPSIGVAGERKEVAEQMEQVFPGLAEQWSISNLEAEAMGTADGSLHMFAWQHAFTETKGRIAELVSTAKDTLPISAPLERIC
ncbi:hypothetical protein BB8028_0006g06400 [Beauveria bassiana]|uniref:Uncharacterized protein n=2 Tax=Beauveria bassiana TaxID=176275 RepID=A0A0A2VUG2_BEABA|nr:hypothetical protein BBAD15_g10335 [Beauveria bassiana D1-5]PQK16320.1 hypothetical protein BB8028_0006g06400 [Beauveria bassiana]